MISTRECIAPGGTCGAAESIRRTKPVAKQNCNTEFTETVQASTRPSAQQQRRDTLRNERARPERLRTHQYPQPARSPFEASPPPLPEHRSSRTQRALLQREVFVRVELDPEVFRERRRVLRAERVCCCCPEAVGCKMEGRGAVSHRNADNRGSQVQSTRESGVERTRAQDPEMRAERPRTTHRQSTRTY